MQSLVICALSLVIGYLCGHLIGYADGYFAQQIGVEHDEAAAGRISKTKRGIRAKSEETISRKLSQADRVGSTSDS